MFVDSIFETDSILDESVNILQEATNSKRIIGTKELKKRLLRQCELILAKEANDQLYHKYVKATKIRRKCRALIHEKYKGKAPARLREYIKAQKEAKKAKPAPKKEQE